MTLKRSASPGSSAGLERLSPSPASSVPILSLPPELLLRIAEYVSNGRPTSSAFSLACVCTIFRDAVFYAIGATLRLSDASYPNAASWAILGRSSVRTLILDIPETPQATLDLLLSPHVKHIKAVTSERVLLALGKRDSGAQLESLVFYMLDPHVTNNLLKIFWKTQPCMVELKFTTGNLFENNEENIEETNICSMQWVLKTGHMYPLLQINMLVTRLVLKSSDLDHERIVSKVLAGMQKMEEMMLQAFRECGFGGGFESGQRIRLEPERGSEEWVVPLLRAIQGSSEWCKKLVAVKLNEALGVMDVRLLRVLTSLTTLQIRLHHGAEQELAEVCRGAKNLKQLKVSWAKREEREGGAARAVPGALLASVRECIWLEELRLGEVRLDGSELDAMLEEVGGGLEELEVDSLGQEETRGQRVKRIVNGVRKWGKRLRRLQVNGLGGLGTETWGSKELIAVVGRLRQMRPLMDMGRLESRVEAAYSERAEGGEGRGSRCVGAEP